MIKSDQSDSLFIGVKTHIYYNFYLMVIFKRKTLLILWDLEFFVQLSGEYAMKLSAA